MIPTITSGWRDRPRWCFWLAGTDVRARHAAGDVWVPASAIQTGIGSNQGKVFRGVEGSYVVTHVNLGRRSKGQIEVLTGLNQGDCHRRRECRQFDRRRRIDAE